MFSSNLNSTLTLIPRFIIIHCLHKSTRILYIRLEKTKKKLRLERCYRGKGDSKFVPVEFRGKGVGCGFSQRQFQ